MRNTAVLAAAVLAIAAFHDPGTVLAQGEHLSQATDGTSVAAGLVLAQLQAGPAPRQKRPAKGGKVEGLDCRPPFYSLIDKKPFCSTGYVWYAPRKRCCKVTIRWK
jgi:hypothetical protein